MGLSQITYNWVIIIGMRRSRLRKSTQHHLIEHFIAGTTARTAAAPCVVNRKTAAYYFHRLREIIYFKLEQDSDAVFHDEVEVDESYFGGKGKRGCGAGGKIPVFGLLKRGGKAFTNIIPDASSASLCQIIERKVMRDSTVYTDT